MSDITLSRGIRSNLLNLQRTSSAIELTQGRLATGKKVNSALDNPTNFFTASSLNSRANDLSSLLDNLSNGIKTLEAADNGLKAITKTVESAQSTVRQARQDKSFKTETYTLNTGLTAASGQKLTFSGGAVGTVGVDVNINKVTKTTAATVPAVVVGDNGKQFTISNGTTATANITLATGDTADAIVTKINAATTTAGNGITAANVNGSIVLTNTSSDTITVAEGTTTGGAAVLGFGATAYTAKSTDELVESINTNASLTDKVRASNVNGGLRIENLSTAELDVAGITTAGVISGGTGAANTNSIDGNSVRRDLVKQFNELRSQLDRLADDSGFNGINLLRGDKLKLSFNETNTSTIEIQAKDSSGNVRDISSVKLGINLATDVQFESDASLDTLLEDLGDALGTLRSQASAFGSNLSVVQNRQDFTKSTINTLRTGADNLTLADVNEEAANLLSLQTRQQLSNTALSLANQADQGVLRLF